MKKSIGVFFISLCLTSHAQIKTSVEVECLSLEQIVSVVTEFGEKPFMIGSTLRSDEKGVEESSMILFVNPQNRTWTVAEKNRTGLYCVLSAGSNMSIIIEKGQGI